MRPARNSPPSPRIDTGGEFGAAGKTPPPPARRRPLPRPLPQFWGRGEEHPPTKACSWECRDPINLPPELGGGGEPRRAGGGRTGGASSISPPISELGGGVGGEGPLRPAQSLIERSRRYPFGVVLPAESRIMVFGLLSSRRRIRSLP